MPEGDKVALHSNDGEGSLLFLFRFVLFPVGFCLINGLFERAGGVGALGDVHQEFIQLGAHLFIHAQAGVEVFVIAEHLQLVLHHGGYVDLRVADALRVLDVVITGFADGNEGLGVLDIPQVEDEVFAQCISLTNWMSFRVRRSRR